MCPKTNNMKANEFHSQVQGMKKQDAPIKGFFPRSKLSSLFLHKNLVESSQIPKGSKSFSCQMRLYS